MTASGLQSRTGPAWARRTLAGAQREARAGFLPAGEQRASGGRVGGLRGNGSSLKVMKLAAVMLRAAATVFAAASPYARPSQPCRPHVHLDRVGGAVFATVYNCKRTASRHAPSPVEDWRWAVSFSASDVTSGVYDLQSLPASL